MNEPPTSAKLAALLPSTEGGKTIRVTAEPGTVVPGITSQSTPTTQPSVSVPTVWPINAIASLNSDDPPPAGCTLYLIFAGGVVT